MSVPDEAQAEQIELAVRLATKFTEWGTALVQIAQPLAGWPDGEGMPTPAQLREVADIQAAVGRSLIEIGAIMRVATVISPDAARMIGRGIDAAALDETTARGG